MTEPARGDSPRPDEHGIAGGAYDNLGRLAFGHPCPWLECLCGYSTPSGAAESWEEAGALLDEHLSAAIGEEHR